MSEDKPTRRAILEAGLVTLAAGTLASVGVAACKSRGDEPRGQSGPETSPDPSPDLSPDPPTDPPTDNKRPPPEPSAALRALALALGPWTAKDRAAAERFLERYVTAERLAGFAEHADAMAELAATLPQDAMALDAIDLSRYSAPQRDALNKVVADLYGINEVKFFIAGHLPPGVCTG